MNIFTGREANAEDEVWPELTVIISSCNQDFLSNIKISINETIGISHEIIVIENSEGRIGICEAYNRGAEMARGRILCFCHEDVLFNTDEWGGKVVAYLEDDTIGLIGVVGCTIKPKAPSRVWISEYAVSRVNMLQGSIHKAAFCKRKNPLEEILSDVAVVDGLWICCRKKVWEANKFDCQLLHGFHGYDIDFSLQVYRSHRVCVVYDIMLTHFSQGSFSMDWLEASLKVYNKWKNVSPLLTVSIPPVAVKSITDSQWELFIGDLARNGASIVKRLRFLHIPLAFRMNFPSSLKVISMIILGRSYTSLAILTKLRKLLVRFDYF